MKKKMNIAVATNQKFMRYLYVMLVSLLENNKSRNIGIYLMTMDLTDGQKNEIRELVESYGQELYFLRLETEMFPENLPVSEKFTLEAYFRLALPELLPEELDRVLYLDADIIVNQSVEELYDTDFEGNTFCACRDVATVTITHIQESPLFEELKGRSDFIYFNSGVLLMNLKRLRENTNLRIFVEQAMQLREHLRFFDQDLLNYMFAGDVRYVDEEKYNLFARTAYNAGYTYEQVKEQTVLLHYAGPKPWSHEEVRYTLEHFWWEYAKMTPYYTELLEDMIITEIDSCYMDKLYRSLKQENEELKQIVGKCMKLLEIKK